MPQLLRIDLAVDQQLPGGFVGTIEGLFGKTIYDVYYKNLNMFYQASGDTVLQAADGRPLYSTSKVNDGFTRVM